MRAAIDKPEYRARKLTPRNGAQVGNIDCLREVHRVCLLEYCCADMIPKDAASCPETVGQRSNQISLNQIRRRWALALERCDGTASNID